VSAARCPAAPRSTRSARAEVSPHGPPLAEPATAAGLKVIVLLGVAPPVKRCAAATPARRHVWFEARGGVTRSDAIKASGRPCRRRATGPVRDLSTRIRWRRTMPCASTLARVSEAASRCFVLIHSRRAWLSRIRLRKEPASPHRSHPRRVAPLRRRASLRGRARCLSSVTVTVTFLSAQSPQSFASSSDAWSAIICAPLWPWCVLALSAFVAVAAAVRARDLRAPKKGPQERIREGSLTPIWASGYFRQLRRDRS
jgi:hypothetical protein